MFSKAKSFAWSVSNIEGKLVIEWSLLWISGLVLIASDLFHKPIYSYLWTKACTNCISEYCESHSVLSNLFCRTGVAFYVDFRCHFILSMSNWHSGKIVKMKSVWTALLWIGQVSIFPPRILQFLPPFFKVLGTILRVGGSVGHSTHKTTSYNITIEPCLNNSYSHFSQTFTSLAKS